MKRLGVAVLDPVVQVGLQFRLHKLADFLAKSLQRRSMETEKRRMIVNAISADQGEQGEKKKAIDDIKTNHMLFGVIRRVEALVPVRLAAV